MYKCKHLSHFCSPLACVVHIKWCTAQPSGIHKWPFHPKCTGKKGDVSECYTGFSMTVVMRFPYPDNTVRNLGFVPLHNDGTGADWSCSHIAGRTARCYNTYANLSNIKQNPTQRNKCKRHATQMYYEWFGWGYMNWWGRLKHALQHTYFTMKRSIII